MRHIQLTVSKCPSREEFPLIEPEHKAHLRRLKADLQQKDQEMLELLQERVTLFCELAEVTSDQEGLQPPATRYMFRADTPQAPRAEKLLLDATAEVDRLSDLLLGSNIEVPILYQHNHMEAGDTSDPEQLVNGAHHFFAAKEVCQRLVNLSVYLHALQGAVIKQDSILELLLQPPDSAAPSPTGGWRPLWRDGAQRESSAGCPIGELALLQRQHSLLQEELLRLRDAESRFKDSEKARAKLERQVRHLKVCSGAPPASQHQTEEGTQQGRTISTNAHPANKETTHQTDDFQEGSDVEVDVTSDDDDADDDGTASESSKDLQDIPEEM